MLYVLFIVLLLLGITDFLTTKSIIKNGGREANQVMEKIIKSFGINNLLIVKLAALSSLFAVTIIVGSHWILYSVYVLLILIFCFVVYKNIQCLESQRN